MSLRHPVSVAQKLIYIYIYIYIYTHTCLKYTDAGCDVPPAASVACTRHKEINICIDIYICIYIFEIHRS